MPVDLNCDVAVIGAGTAGLATVRSARRAGAHALIIDPDFSGTTCANVGCMPSKLLIAAGNAAHDARHAALFGVHASPVVDGPAALRRLREERDRFAEATRDDIATLPQDIRIASRARFVDGTTLALDDGRTVRAKAIVIATGSRPSVPDLFDPIADLVLTNESIFELESLPSSLAVIGAGPLGLELAQAMARLGVAVTVLDKGKVIAAVDDETIASRIKAVLGREFEIALDVDITSEKAGDRARLSWSGAESVNRTFDRVLVATGRPPAVGALDLERTGLALDPHGVPVFDRETMRCGESAIYIAGDADADRAVLHEASAEGALAGANAAHHPDVKPGRRAVPLSVMFTDPPLASIGRRTGGELVTGEAEYRDQGRAKVEGRAEGLARLHAAPGDGRLIGATLFCPGADHLAHLLAWSIEDEASANQLLDRPFYHPTLEEGLKPALRSICTQIGLEPPSARDDGAIAGA